MPGKLALFGGRSLAGGWLRAVHRSLDPGNAHNSKRALGAAVAAASRIRNPEAIA